jgi:hypothetical protein
LVFQTSWGDPGILSLFKTVASCQHLIPSFSVFKLTFKIKLPTPDESLSSHTTDRVQPEKLGVEATVVFSSTLRAISSEVNITTKRRIFGHLNVPSESCIVLVSMIEWCGMLFLMVQMLILRFHLLSLKFTQL